MNNVVYRAVKANENNDVIAIGYDENQANKDYNGIGVWCDFTFTEIPQVDSEVAAIVDQDVSINLLKVEDGAIIAKTLEEVKAELEPKEKVTE